MVLRWIGNKCSRGHPDVGSLVDSKVSGDIHSGKETEIDGASGDIHAIEIMDLMELAKFSGILVLCQYMVVLARFHTRTLQKFQFAWEGWMIH